MSWNSKPVQMCAFCPPRMTNGHRRTARTQPVSPFVHVPTNGPQKPAVMERRLQTITMGAYERLFEESRSTAQLFTLRCRIEGKCVSRDSAEKIYFAFDWFYLSGGMDAERLWRALHAIGVGDLEFDDLIPSVSVQLKRLQRIWRSRPHSLSQSFGTPSPSTDFECRR